MILELDCGNTRIKWRVLDTKRQCVNHRGHCVTLAEFSQQLSALGYKYSWCRVSAVKSWQAHAGELVQVISGHCQGEVIFAKSTRVLHGVTNGYTDTNQLGVDRWLAIVAAYKKIKGACLVIDMGTAMTVDFVSAQGEHLGGVIAPGVGLLVESLQRHTELGAAKSHEELYMGRSTESCINAGLQAMCNGFLKQQYKTAARVFTHGYRVIVSGGDSSWAVVHWPAALVVPEIVFEGLALACPE